jgi:hypothetical protein
MFAVKRAKNHAIMEFKVLSLLLLILSIERFPAMGWFHA